MEERLWWCRRFIFCYKNLKIFCSIRTKSAIKLWCAKLILNLDQTPRGVTGYPDGVSICTNLIVILILNSHNYMLAELAVSIILYHRGDTNSYISRHTNIFLSYSNISSDSPPPGVFLWIRLFGKLLCQWCDLSVITVTGHTEQYGPQSHRHVKRPERSANVHPRYLHGRAETSLPSN